MYQRFKQTIHSRLPLIVIVIVDSNFEDEIKTNSLWFAIDVIYSKRGLNVAANMARAMMYESSNDIDINECFAYARKTVGNFSRYEQDIQKYLLLL